MPSCRYSNWIKNPYKLKSRVHPSGNYVDRQRREVPTKVALDDHKSEAVDFKIIWSSSADISECESHFSLLELIELPTEVPSQNAYAYFYPPSYPIYQASQDEKPPLSLESYGGKQDSWCCKA